jgi:hypothetical protein
MEKAQAPKCSYKDLSFILKFGAGRYSSSFYGKGTGTQAVLKVSFEVFCSSLGP